jgi:dsRNA-specific ribonuclease
MFSLVLKESFNMMKMHEQMMKDMQEMNTLLDQRVAAMNAAAGEQDQIEAIKAVINEMVTQRKDMMSKMTAMHGQMCNMMSCGGMVSMMGGSGMMKGMHEKAGEKR